MTGGSSLSVPQALSVVRPGAIERETPAPRGSRGLLAIAGLYGVIACNVSRRTREIGIRMALGARQPDILRMVMSKGLALVGMGTAFGLAMGLVTILAAYFPARRAREFPT